MIRLAFYGSSLLSSYWNGAATYYRGLLSALAPLATSEDPGRPLDMFPRELETREETAQPLVDAIWDNLAAIAVAREHCAIQMYTSGTTENPKGAPLSHASLLT